MIQHNILVENHYAYIEVRQSPPLVEFLAAARLFISDPDYSPELHCICDFSQANLSHITHADVVRFVHFVSTRIKRHPRTKCAVVAPDSQRSGIFEAIIQQLTVGNFMVFEQPDDAVQWITGRAANGKFDMILGGVA
jgi:hypothetical protein